MNKGKELKTSRAKQSKPNRCRGNIDGVSVYCNYDALIKTSELKPNPRNPNTHPEEQIRLLASIIKKQGWRAPITVSKNSGYIVRGHGKLAAAVLLGLSKVPVEFQVYKSALEEQADLIADNRIAELSTIDNETLIELLYEMQQHEFDMSLTGFESEELSDMLQGEGNVAEEPVPAPPKKAITKRGDLYQLGNHKLLCGDSTSPEDVSLLMRGEKAQLLFTDPPYGVAYESETLGNIKNDNHKGNDLLNKLLIPALNLATKHTKDNAAFFIWHATSTKQDFDFAVKAAGLEEKQVIIWIKPSFVLGRADYHWKHEPCIYAQKCGKRALYTGERDQSTVWEISVNASAKGSKGIMSIANGLKISHNAGKELYIRSEGPKNARVRRIRLDSGQSIHLTHDDSNTDTWSVTPDDKNSYIHPTQKPVELALRALKNHTRKGDIVLDMFGGSGSTLIASEARGRKARLMELDERFCDAIVSRYRNYCERNGLKAVVKLNGKAVKS